jgi:hypothetical protein
MRFLKIVVSQNCGFISQIDRKAVVKKKKEVRSGSKKTRVLTKP